MKYYLCILFIILNFPLKSEETRKVRKEDYLFHQVSPPGGFTYDRILRIKQDSIGYIWVLLENELFRYDGYEYKTFFQSDTPELKNRERWVTYDLAVDGNDLYLATNKGLFLLNRRTEEFELFDSGVIYKIFTIGNNKIWTSLSGELFTIDLKTKEKEKLLYDERPIQHISSSYNTDFNTFILASGNRVLEINKSQETIKEIFTSDNIENIIGIAQRDNYLFLVLQKKGIYLYDLFLSKKIEELYFIPKRQINEVNIRDILIDTNNNLWIATQSGLYNYDIITNKYHLHKHEDENKFSVSNNSVRALYEDINSDLWIGTYAGGLSYLSARDIMKFKTTHPTQKGLSYPVVSCFEENDNYLWIGTEGGGLDQIDKQTNSFKNYTLLENELSSKNVKSLAYNDDLLWIATFGGGLNCLNTTTGEINHFSTEKDGKISLLYNNLKKVVLEKDKGLWIAYQIDKAVLSFFSFQDESTLHFELDTVGTNNFIYDIVIDSTSVWALTYNNLYQVELATRKINKVDLGDNIALNARTIYSNNRDLWIGTAGLGLLRYNIGSRSFSLENDISSFNKAISVHSITYADGFLWLGTDYGLLRYSRKNKKMYQYLKEEGLQGNLYYPLAIYKSKDAEKIHIGGTNGFSTVYINNFLENQTLPEIMISEVLTDNTPYKIREKGGLPFIEVKHGQKLLSIKCASTNYLHSEKNKYKYQLSGSNSWIDLGTDRIIKYYNLPYGEYKLKILSANNDGLWGNTPYEILIKSTPPWWRSTLAYFLYTFITALLVFIILRIYLRNQKLNYQIAFEKLEQASQNELFKSQLSFFVGVTHDLRTPLSIITSAVNNIQKEGSKKSDAYLQSINKNVGRLTNLINEILDYKRIENKTAPNLEKIDLNLFINDISNDFHPLASKRQIEINHSFDDSIGKVNLDKSILEKIIMNLIGNALKYSKENSKILIETYNKKFSNNFTSYKRNITIPHPQQFDNYITIAIKDSGTGISEKSLKSIFTKYYSSSESEELVSGIGLALVKKLVEFQKGNIRVYSETNKGTDFFIELPTQIKEISHPTDKNSPINVADYTQFIESGRLTVSDKKKVLLVEDNAELSMFISDFLESSYDIILAEDGEVALEILDEEYIDLIISDVMMPRMDGIELCKRIRSDIEISHIPFLFLTAKTNTESHFEGIYAGANFYIVKPIDLNLLKLYVDNIFLYLNSLREFYSNTFFTDTGNIASNKNDRDFLLNLSLVLDNNISNSQLNVDFIASELAMSRSKLYNKLKALTGKSTVEYILDFRMKHAVKLMLEEDLSILEVTNRVGLRSQSYFTNVFKKRFGMPPGEFVTQHRVDNS